LDYDNDGDLYLMIVNGHVNPMIGSIGKLVTYKEPRFSSPTMEMESFKNMKGQAGAHFKPYAARGMALGDLTTMVTAILSLSA